MAKTGYMNVRIDGKGKKEGEKILEELGLSVSDAIRLFLRQVVSHRGLPFEMRVGTEAKKRAL